VLSSVGALVDSVAREINLAISKTEREKKFEMIEKSHSVNISRVMDEVSISN
jgi:hypothetical protein